MIYLLLKTLHVSAAGLSLLLFATRGFWALTHAEKLQRRWVRVVPHIVDTVLLLAAIGLVIVTAQYPFVEGWVTAKVIALIAYIGVGTIAIKRGRTPQIKAFAFVIALLIFGYIVGVAFTRSPSLGFF